MHFRCLRIRDPALLSHMVAARVFTHAQVPYFSLMRQRPLWSKCQRLTHHADVLVRPTAAEDFMSPTWQGIFSGSPCYALPKHFAFDLTTKWYLLHLELMPVDARRGGKFLDPSRLLSKRYWIINEVNRRVICTLSELITRYLRVQQLIRLLLLEGNYQQTFWVKVLYIQLFNTICVGPICVLDQMMGIEPTENTWLEVRRHSH